MSLFNLIHILIGGFIIGNLLNYIGFCLPKIMLASEQELKKPELCQLEFCWHQLPIISWWFGLKAFLKPQPGLVVQSFSTQVSWRFPLMEIASGLLLWLAFAQFGFGLDGWLIAGLFITLLLITYIDLEHYLILDVISLPLVWAGLLLNAFGVFTSAEQAILGAVAGYLILWTIFHAYRISTGKLAMGYGDFKLLAALGAWFGLAAVPQILFIAAILSVVFGLILVVLQRNKLDQAIAFGPYLAMAGIFTVTYGSLLNF